MHSRTNFRMWFWQDVDETAMLKELFGKTYSAKKKQEFLDDTNGSLDEFTKMPPESHCGLLIYPMLHATEAVIGTIKTRAFLTWEKEGQKGGLELCDDEKSTIIELKKAVYYLWCLWLFG